MIDPVEPPPVNAIPYPGGSKVAKPEAFAPRHGEAVVAEPGILRVTANNASHFTFMGTNSYVLLGEDNEAIIVDAGPNLALHTEALVRALGTRRLVAILVTHSHVDHTTGLDDLRLVHDAPVHGLGPHRLARSLVEGEDNPMHAAGDWAYQPDVVVTDGDLLQIAGLTLEAIATPGHAANHVAYALNDTGTVFIGDHMMEHTSTIIAPPEGDMAAYMTSLTALKTRTDRVYYPGHGGAVPDPASRIDELIAHRQHREAALLGHLSQQAQPIPDLVRAIYTDINSAMMGAAALSLQAQLEYLVQQDRVIQDGPIPARAHYRLA